MVSVLANTRELKIIIFNSAFFNRINDHWTNDYGVQYLFTFYSIGSLCQAVR